MDTRLIEVEDLSQKDRLPAYQALVNEILSRPDAPSIVQDVHALVNAVVQDNNVVTGRQILTTIAEQLSAGTGFNKSVKKEIVEDILDTVQPRIVSYEEQVSGENP